MDKSNPRVWIIGAGPTGLVALRHLKDIADWVWYEIKDQIGGLWVYKDTTDLSVDKEDMYYKLYGHTHESIYNDLTTIIPKHFFAFKDFPPSLEKLHYTHQEMLDYLKSYWDHFELGAMIQFRTTVTNVSQYSSPRWKVTISFDGSEQEEFFDYVVVCNGHTI